MARMASVGLVPLGIYVMTLTMMTTLQENIGIIALFLSFISLVSRNLLIYFPIRFAKNANNLSPLITLSNISDRV